MDKGKTYREYRVITREQAFARGFDLKYLNVSPTLGDRSRHYDYKVARRLLERYPGASRVEFCRPQHNEARTRYTPAPDTVIYVKSTHGRWGKSARTIPGTRATAAGA